MRVFYSIFALIATKKGEVSVLKTGKKCSFNSVTIILFLWPCINGYQPKLMEGTGLCCCYLVGQKRKSLGITTLGYTYILGKGCMILSFQTHTLMANSEKMNMCNLLYICVLSLFSVRLSCFVCVLQVLCSNSVLDSSEYWLRNEKALCRLGLLDDDAESSCTVVSSILHTEQHAHRFGSRVISTCL